MKIASTLQLALILSLLAANCTAQSAQSIPAQEVARISASDTRKMVENGNAILACAYPDDLCKDMLLGGAILLSEFESELPDLPKDQPIIFYCA